jgi:hypothetical protein
LFVDPTGAEAAVRTRGGWVQVTFHPHHEWRLGGAFGVDDPEDDDVGASLLKNSAWQGHLQWRPLPVIVGVEVRRHSTFYPAPTGRQDATHMNLGMGFAF